MNLRPTILLLLLISSAATAQLAPAPDAPPAESQPTQSHPQPEPTLQATANLVDLEFIAKGPEKQLIPNLAKTACTITEDNKPQTIQSFTAESNQPLTLGVLLDTSLSQQRVLPTEQRAAAAFLRRILQPKDEAFLIAFDVDVTMLSDFTASPGNLKKAIDNAQINSASGNYANGTIPPIGKPRGTVLYDAIVLAATQKLRPEVGRKAIILLTNGVDQGSRMHLAAAIEAAQKANAIVYVLLIQDPGLYGVIEETNDGPMQKLVRATGGELFKIGSNGRKMQTAFAAIESQLRSQYQITYTPTNSKRDGTFRQIRIKCLQNDQPLHIQARQGYYTEHMK
jgi:VWFA-related protein